MQSAAAERVKVQLLRRGVRHGTFVADIALDTDLSGPQLVDYALPRWRADEPLVVRGASRAGVRRASRDIVRSLALFEALRGGASFELLAARRLARAPFRPAGVTIDLGDTREIEKLFVDALSASGRAVARDLYAKLSWIAHDERDTSLRVRFSFGAEALLDWQKETRRARWSDAFARALFPECRVIDENRALLALVEHMVGRRVRLSERIIYNHAPGGGATFHHDDEPRQLGVVFTQLQGATAWFALPKRRLAEHVAATARTAALRQRAGTPRKALRALDDTSDPLLGKLLNATPSFTRRLVEHGEFYVLRAGDSILLPSHGPDDVCWHAVFALGAQASLAHSYGVFPLRDAPLSATRARGAGRTSARSRDAR
jgi:hypothetical protein